MTNPTILYGTEHGFNQGGVNNKGLHDGDYQRECMWNFGYQWGNAQGDKFNTPSPIVDLIKQINQAREQHPSLRRGNLIKRWDSNSTPPPTSGMSISASSQVAPPSNMPSS
jgi:hypothetical protein